MPTRQFNRRTFIKSSVATGIISYFNFIKADTVETPRGREILQRYKRGNTPDYTKNYDVVVAGAGLAGVTAAIAAARMGLKVGLIEKTIQSGGLSTIGLSNIFAPLDDGNGTQVTCGIVEELMIASQNYDPRYINSDWKSKNQRYCAEFSSIGFIYVLDKFIKDSKIDVIYDMLVCNPVLKNNTITGIEVENTMGKGLINAKCVIDATGTGEVAFRAGSSCFEAENDAKFAAIIKEDYKYIMDEVPKEYLPKRKYKGTNQDVSHFALDTRQAFGKYYLENQKTKFNTGRDPVGMFPVMPQIDKIRSVEGKETLTTEMVNKNIDTSVGLVADWQTKGEVYPIPYGSLLPKNIKGLVTTGRCISVKDDASWDVIKVNHARAHIGEIAGIAVSLAVKNNTTPDTLDVKTVQTKLAENGIKFKI